MPEKKKNETKEKVSKTPEVEESKAEEVEETEKPQEKDVGTASATQPETVIVSRQEFEELRALVNATADKGRVLAHQQRQDAGNKKPLSIKLSKYQGGYITGWRTVTDKLVQHPTTGKTVGEEQEYEVLVLQPDGETLKLTIKGYPQFSEARYGERAECQVVGKSEDYEGQLTFKVQLPDGRVIDLPSQFVN